ncbi:hypothetical protein [Sphingomonas sp. ID0503]|uniref:hypothetical protein n=1 Tax=Sphingomonas sp. ID0503 TaxID=3399691 RepID=UPI003AFA9BC6
MSEQLNTDERRILRAIFLGEEPGKDEPWPTAMAALIERGFVEVMPCAGLKLPVCTTEGAKVARFL